MELLCKDVSHWLGASLESALFHHRGSCKIAYYNSSHNIWECWWNITHWGQVMHICVRKLTIIGSDNGLSPGRHQAIIRTNDGKLLIVPLRTNISEILIVIHTFSLKIMHLKMLSGNWRPFRLGLNVIILWSLVKIIAVSPHERQNIIIQWMYYFISYMLFYVLNTQFH